MLKKNVKSYNSIHAPDVNKCTQKVLDQFYEMNSAWIFQRTLLVEFFRAPNCEVNDKYKQKQIWLPLFLLFFLVKIFYFIIFKSLIPKEDLPDWSKLLHVRLFRLICKL